MILSEREVNPWYRATTPIKYPRIEGHATGFFYIREGNPYLITNRHVLYDLEEGDRSNFRPESIAIRIRSRENYSETIGHRIELYDDNDEPNWLEHPNHHVDIAAVPLDIDWDSNSNTSFAGGGYWGLPVSEAQDEEYGFLRPDFGDSAVVVGYPVLDSTDYLPVARNALISSQYGRFHRDMPYFLIDANLHDGTSGSPVIYTRKTSDGNTHAHLLGVHSGPYDKYREGSENLNRVWYRKTILGLFGEFPVQQSVTDF